MKEEIPEDELLPNDRSCNESEQTVSEFPEPPSYSGLAFRELILCNGIFNGDLKIFSSYDNYRLYKDFSKQWISAELFERAKYNQNLTKGLPLMVAKRAWHPSFGETKYLKLYVCPSTPDIKDRLYKSNDDKLIATVFKRSFFRYTRFRLKYSNNTIVIFYHHLLEIMDFEYNGKRYRFYKTDLSRYNPNHFAYDLFMLTDEQPSLLDQMTAKFTIAKENKLLGDYLDHILKLRMDSIQDGELISPHLWGKFQSCKRDALFSRTIKTCIFSLYTPVPPDLNLNSSVDQTTMMFTAICSILKNLEIDLGAQGTPIISPFRAGPAPIGFPQFQS